MLIPREIAELRLVQINRHVDRKKRPHGLGIEDIAPQTLFHHERVGSEERKAREEAAANRVEGALAADVPKEADGRIPLVILEKPVEENG